MERTTTDVDAWLAAADGPHGEALRALDAVVSAELGGRERVLWEGVFWGGTQQQILGYGGIVQPRPRGEDVSWFLVGLAAQKRHLSLYVNAVADGAYLVQRYADRLGRVRVGSAAVTIPSLEHVDLAGVRALAAEALAVTPDVT